MLTRRTLLQLPLLASVAGIAIPAFASLPPIDLTKQYGGVYKFCFAQFTDAEIAVKSPENRTAMMGGALEALGPGVPIAICHIPFDRREFDYGDILACYEYWVWKYEPDPSKRSGVIVCT